MNELTITDKDTHTVHTLTLRFIDVDASGKSSAKAIYELAPSTSIHGSSRSDMIALLKLKFGFTTAVAERVVAHLENSVEAERVVRKTTDAPRIIGGGIPTRPLAARN